MAQLDLPSTLMPSLKDRLLDPGSTGTKGQPGYTLRQVFDSVREDVEDLLNSRRSYRIQETQYPELARSIAAFGLPDLTSMDTSTPGKQEAVGQVIEKIVALFEPRLRNVRIHLVRSRAVDMRATFHIDAELSVDPFPEVAFESVLELATGRASIRERGG